MASIYDTNPNELIEKTAQELKKHLTMPSWAFFVKTGHFKVKPPMNNDWWFYRGASLLRKIALNGPLGVSRLRNLYGGKKNRGHRPEHKYSAAGKAIRVLLQQLEKAELIKQTQKGTHKGRILTSKGEKFLASQSKALKVKPSSS